MALLTNSCWSVLPSLASFRGKRASKHASTWCPSASLVTLARSVALQVRAPEPCLRRASGALPYAIEGGSPGQTRALKGLPPEGLSLTLSSSSWGRSQEASCFRDLGLLVTRLGRLAPVHTLHPSLDMAP